MKLNKNQKKFFHVAVNYFGDKSNDVRFKDLKSFAEEHDLIIPTSALKNYCQEEDQVRGHYNLTLTGFTPDPLPDPEPEFEEKDAIIVNTSAFVEPVARKKSKRFNPKGMKPKKLHHPIYIISYEGDVVSVHETPEGAFKSGVKYILHDHGDRTMSDAILEMRYRGAAVVQSSNSIVEFVLAVYNIST